MPRRGGQICVMMFFVKIVCVCVTNVVVRLRYVMYLDIFSLLKFNELYARLLLLFEDKKILGT